MLMGCGSSLFPYCSSVNLKINTNLWYQDMDGAEQAPSQQSLAAGITLTVSFEEPLVLTFCFEPRIAFRFAESPLPAQNLTVFGICPRIQRIECTCILFDC